MDDESNMVSYGIIEGENGYGEYLIVFGDEELEPASSMDVLESLSVGETEAQGDN